MNKIKPLISICCLTFNHEKYIDDAMKGFVMQEADFEYEIFVHDDASTDQTAKIVEGYAKQYPNKIHFIKQRENQYSKGIDILSKYILPKIRGKYVALCDGDDYWVDSSKLQKQVDFLEKNQRYGMTHSDHNRFYEQENILISNYNKTNEIKIPQGDVFEFLLHGNFISTCTACFRKILLDEYYDYDFDEGAKFKMGDYPLWLSISQRSLVAYADESLATYRISPGTASRANNIEDRYKFEESVFNIREYFIDKYGCDEDVEKNTFYTAQAERLRHAFATNNYEMAKAVFSNFHRKKIPPLNYFYLYLWGTSNLLARFIITIYFKYSSHGTK